MLASYDNKSLFHIIDLIETWISKPPQEDKFLRTLLVDPHCDLHISLASFPLPLEPLKLVIDVTDSKTLCYLSRPRMDCLDS